MTIDSDKAYLDQTPPNQLEGAAEETPPVICEIQTVLLAAGTSITLRTRQRGTHWHVGVVRAGWDGANPIVVSVGQGEDSRALPSVVMLSYNGSVRLPATSTLLTVNNLDPASDPCYVTVMMVANAGENYIPGG